LEIYRKLERFV